LHPDLSTIEVQKYGDPSAGAFKAGVLELQAMGAVAVCRADDLRRYEGRVRSTVLVTGQDPEPVGGVAGLLSA